MARPACELCGRPTASRKGRHPACAREAALAELRRTVGRTGLTETCVGMARRLGLRTTMVSAEMEKMLIAGEVQMVGHRYFPTKWLEK